MSLADYDSTTAIFGRDDEVSRLQRIVADASQGRRQVAVVSGELGIGKTTLVTQVLSSTDAYQLVGGCLPAEGEPMPFGPITSSLRCLMRSLPAKDADALAESWPQAFLDFLPFEFFGAHPHDITRIEDTQLSSSGQARLFEWLLTVICRLSRDRPLVWVIEDVHWADRSTLDLIAFLARNLTTEPITLLLTLRTDEVDHNHFVRRWLVELDRLEGVTRLNLRRLSRQATERQLAELVAQTDGDAHRNLTDLIYQHSEGNPLFSVELVSWAHDHASQWPDTLYDLVASRLAAVPPTTRTVLDAAAVLGRSYSLVQLSDVLGREAREVERELAPAIDRHLVEPHSSHDYAFAGPLIQEVLEADLLPGERRRLHEAAARTKSSQLGIGSDSQFDLVAEIAHHWDVAQVETKAFAATVDAGLSAERLYAFVEADRYFARAVAMPCAAQPEAYQALSLTQLDQLDLLLHASQAAHMVGDGVRAIALIDEAAALSDDPIRLAALLERKGAYCFNTGRVEVADEAYRKALTLLPDEPSTLRARVLGGLGLLAMAWSRMAEAESLCHEAIQVARAVGARHAEARALNALGVVTSYRGELDEGIEHSRAAVAIAEELDSADDMATAYIDLAHVLDLAGRFDEAVEVCRVGYDAMCRVGLARQDGSFLQANAAESLIKAGRWSEAAALLADARASQTRGLRVFPVLEHEARLRMRMGDLERAEECVEQARSLFAEFDAPDAWHREFHEVAAELLVWLGRPRDALEEAQAGLAFAEGSDEERMAGPLILTAVQSVAELLEAARAQRDSEQCAELLGCAEGLRARAHGLIAGDTNGGYQPLPEAHAVAITIDAEFLRCQGAASTADQWAAVAAQWLALGQPFPAAYANWREAESLVMSKQVGHRPVAAVRRAHEAAVVLGAAGLIVEVENLARWGRIELGPSSVATVGGTKVRAEFGLTQREQEVLAGLLAGQTNREIAESLFISTKTSSVHVSNILRKLGVKTREEAARVAHRQISGG